MARIMVCDARPSTDEVRRAVAALSALGFRVDGFSDCSSFLEATVATQPDLVVYTLCSELGADLGVLRLLRRSHPDVELVLSADQPSLQTRVAVQALRPMFCSVGPLDSAELIEVVQAAVRRRARSSHHP